MPLSDEEVERIGVAVAKQLESSCHCGLTKEAQEQMPHLLGMIKDVGRDNYASGIEVMRDIGKKYSRMSRTGEIVSQMLIYSFLISLMGGVVYLIKCGVETVVKALK